MKPASEDICPKCRSADVRYGIGITVAGNPVLAYVCQRCNHRWKDEEK